MAIVDELLIWLQNWAGIIAGLGSLVLSALLVLLYRQQRDILNEQKELTKSTKEAVLRVEDIDFAQGSKMQQFVFQYAGDFEPWRVHQDYFLIHLSNFGDSPAIDLHLEVRMHFGNSGDYFLIRIPLSRSVFVSNQLAFNEDSDVIGSGERNTFFVAQMSVEKDTIPDHWAKAVPDAPESLAPSEVMYSASEAGESELSVQIFLDYGDSTGDRDPIKIHAVEFDPKEFNDLGSAIKQGTYLFD